MFDIFLIFGMETYFSNDIIIDVDVVFVYGP